MDAALRHGVGRVSRIGKRIKRKINEGKRRTFNDERKSMNMGWKTIPELAGGGVSVMT